MIKQENENPKLNAYSTPKIGDKPKSPLKKKDASEENKSSVVKGNSPLDMDNFENANAKANSSSCKKDPPQLVDAKVKPKMGSRQQSKDLDEERFKS